MSHGREGELVEPCRLDVRREAPRAVAGDSAVLPRLVAAAGGEEVERERRRFVLERIGSRLDRLCHPRVQLAAAPERQPLVRRIADKRVPEAHPAGGIGFDQSAQPLPQRGVELDVVAHRRGEQRPVEHGPEHGCVPEYGPVRRRQSIDLGGDDGLDGVGQRLRRPGRAGDVEELEHEQRAAAGPPGNLLHLVRPQRLRVRRELDDPGRLPLGERQEREADVAEPVLVLARPVRGGVGLRDEERVRE